MPHRATLNGLVHIADMHEQVLGVPPVDPDLAISPQAARTLAVELVERADAAEGYEGAHGFVTRLDLLMRLRILEDKITRMVAEP